MSELCSTNQTIRFLLNGELIETTDIEPAKSVLHYLREEKNLTGTKEGKVAKHPPTF